VTSSKVSGIHFQTKSIYEFSYLNKEGHIHYTSPTADLRMLGLIVVVLIAVVAGIIWQIYQKKVASDGMASVERKKHTYPEKEVLSLPFIRAALCSRKLGHFSMAASSCQNERLRILPSSLRHWNLSMDINPSRDLGDADLGDVVD